MDELQVKQAELRELMDYLKKSKGVNLDGVARNIGMSPNSLTQVVRGHRGDAKKVSNIIMSIKNEFRSILPESGDYSTDKTPQYIPEKDKLTLLLERTDEIKLLLEKLLKNKQ